MILNNVDMEYSEKVRKFIEVKGLNNRDLANRLGKSEVLIGRWLNAEKPSMDFILAMIKAFPDFDLNYVLKDKVNYPSFEEIESAAAEDKEEYSLTANDLINDIESKLSILKKKVAQNSHK